MISPYSTNLDSQVVGVLDNIMGPAIHKVQLQEPSPVKATNLLL